MMMQDDRDLMPGIRPAVRQRVRRVGGAVNPQGRWVLYWLRQAARDHDNPALDAALEAGALLGLPVLVYQGLDERHPWASDRLHTFQLEGAIDLARAFAEQRICYRLHVARPGHRGPHLRTLAGQSALVVTEDVPVSPLAQWTQGLATDPGVAVWEVDTHCVLPMRRIDGEHRSASAFRRATDEARRRAVRAGWTDAPRPTEALIPTGLPFEPVDPLAVDLQALVASCAIDHAVPRVWDTPGGMVAARRRWHAFREGPLDRYARDRNDAARAGVSRMSAYLHFGHISPFEMARDVIARGAAGADKFLDELLTWREFAWHRALVDPEPRWGALPEWARTSLLAHASVEGGRSWETLARGRTGSALWDLAQRSLLRHGELHNNVRMTWGKGVLRWCGDPRRALRVMVDLNHRYALDGRDPSSHLGLMWCLGYADRPFRPAQPGWGWVRPREIEDHARRLDVDRYASRVTRPRRARPQRVAVVGAGLSGLMCARTLLDQGEEVVVWEKSRGPGGRTSTRRDGDVTFDHGAVRLDLSLEDRRLAPWVASWWREGILERWSVLVREPEGLDGEREESWWVARGASNRLARHLAEELDVRYRSEVGRLSQEGRGWQLWGEDGERLDEVDRIVVSAPPPQAAGLLAEVDPRLAGRLRACPMVPVWALMTRAREEDAPVGPAAVRWRTHPVLSVAYRVDALPGREGPARWVIHATESWSGAHLEVDASTAARLLTEAWEEQGGMPLEDRGRAHRWRYARATGEAVGSEAWWGSSGAVVCGDAVGGGGVRGALLSGWAAAGWLLSSRESGDVS